MAKTKYKCPECEEKKAVAQESVESYWFQGKEITEVIVRYACQNCGYEWETKSGS